MFSGELSIAKTGGRRTVAVRRVVFPIAAAPSFAGEEARASPWCGKIVLEKPLCISRRSTLQLVGRLRSGG